MWKEIIPLGAAIGILLVMLSIFYKEIHNGHEIFHDCLTKYEHNASMYHSKPCNPRTDIGSMDNGNLTIFPSTTQLEKNTAMKHSAEAFQLIRRSEIPDLH